MYQTMGDRAVFYYRFDGDSGTSVVTDLSFSHNNGTYCTTGSPCTTATVSVGSGLSSDTYNGSGNSLFGHGSYFIETPVTVGTNLNETMSLWIKTSDPNPNIIAAADANWSRRIVAGQPGQWYFKMDATHNTAAPTTPVSLSDNKWHNFAYTLSTVGTTQTITAYLDGKQVGSAPPITSVPYLIAGNGPWYIGTSCGGSSCPIAPGDNTYIDDVMYFNQAVAYEGMQKIYAEGVARHNLAVK
jgi:hypothetical protein